MKLRSKYNIGQTLYEIVGYKIKEKTIFGVQINVKKFPGYKSEAIVSYTFLDQYERTYTVREDALKVKNYFPSKDGAKMYLYNLIAEM